MPEPKIAQKKPYVMDVKAGTYYWCGCGHSKNQPFCDGSHKAAGFEGEDNCPRKVDIKEDGKVPWCGCKHTKTPPWCDGAHTKL